MLSLLDLEKADVIDCWAVFRDQPPETTPTWFWRRFKKGFAHVEIWKQQGEVWIRVEPCLEYANVTATLTPPWEWVPAELNPTFMRVVRAVPLGKVRDWFFVGPITCVELSKAFLGIRNAFVRTPHQLYRLLKADRG